MLLLPPLVTIHSPLFHSSRSGCATHQDHLAIHIGPVLLITRLELRTKNRDENRELRRRSLRLKRKDRGTTEGIHRPSVPPRRDPRPVPFLYRLVSGKYKFGSFRSFSSRLLLLRTTTIFYTANIRALCAGPRARRLFYIYRMLFSVQTRFHVLLPHARY